MTGYRYALNTGVGAGINRFWRDLNEQNESFKVDLSYPYGEKSKLKLGALTLFKQRDFEVLDYAFRLRGNVVTTDNPDDFFLPENQYVIEFLPHVDTCPPVRGRSRYAVWAQKHGARTLSDSRVHSSGWRWPGRG